MSTENEDVLYTVTAEDRASAVFEHLKEELAKLGIEARIAGDSTSAGMDKVDQSARKAASGVNVSARDITNSFNTINTVMGGVTPSISARALKITGAMGLIASGAAATSAVSGAALASLPLLFAGAAALMVKTAVESNAQLQASFQASGDSIKATMLQASAPMIQTFAVVAAQGASALKAMGPALHDAFATAAPLVQTISTGLIGFVQNILPHLTAAMQASAPAVQALAGGLSDLGAGLGYFFENLSSGAAGGAKGLGALFSLLNGLLPVLGQFLADISGPASAAMATLSDFVVGLVTALLGGLTPVLNALLPVFASLLGALTPLFPVIQNLIAAFAPVITDVGSALVPVFKELVGVIAALVPHLIPLLDPLISLVDPIVAMIGPLGQLAVTLGAPLLDAVTQILPLLQSFQDTVSGGLGQALLGLGQAIVPLIPPLVGLAKVLAASLLGAITALLPALAQLVQGGLGALIQALSPILPLFGKLISELLPPLVKLVVALLGAIMPLLEPLLQLAGFILGKVIEGLTDFANKALIPVIELIAAHLGPAVQSLMQWFRDLWDTTTRVWAGIAADVGKDWAWLQQYVFNPTADVIAGMARGFTWFWQSVIVPVWNGIRDAIGAVWDWLSRNVFAPIGQAIDVMATAFRNVVEAVKTAWDRLQDVVAAPVRFIVKTVWDDGLLNAWNAVSGAFGGPHLDPVPVNFARGGVVPGYSPGNDVVSAMLSPGEGILVPQAVRALGGASGIGAINRAYGGGGSSNGNRYADGGVVNPVNWANAAADAINSIPLVRAMNAGMAALGNVVAGGLQSAVAGVFDSVIKPLLGVIPGLQGGRLGALLVSGVNTAEAGILAFLGGKDASAAVGAPGGMPGDLPGWIQQAMTVMGVSGANWLNGLEVIAMHESSGNPNAVNMTDSNALAGHPSKGIMQTIQSTFEAYRSASLPDDVFDPIANIAAGIGYINSRYGGIGGVPGLVAMAHGGDYVGYDSGGYLEPGLTLAYNGTGGREVVVPNGAGRFGGAPQIHYHVDIHDNNGTFDDKWIRQLWDALGRHATTVELPLAGVQVRR